MSLGFPGGSVVKTNLPIQGTQRSLGWEDPLEESMALYSSVLAWRIPMARGVWQAMSPWVHKESGMIRQLNNNKHI